MAAHTQENSLPLSAQKRQVQMTFMSQTPTILWILLRHHVPSISCSRGSACLPGIHSDGCRRYTHITEPVHRSVNQLSKIKVIVRLSASHGHTSCILWSILASQCTVGALCNQVYALAQSLGCAGAAPDYTWQEKGISSTGRQIECSKATAQLHTLMWMHIQDSQMLS